MKVRFDTEDLQQTKWYEYCLRFFFGGTVTALTGVIARKFGPGIGGLFLAFPAIFPAAASLMEKEQKEKKAKAGLDGSVRGREVAANDAAGTAMGTVGLMVFAILVWLLIDRYPAWIVLLGSTVAWFVAAASTWYAQLKLR